MPKTKSPPATESPQGAPAAASAAAKYQYDLVVIGSGPSGEKAAIQASKLGKSVLMVEKKPAPGGSCLHLGTIPSKTLRESVVRYAQMRSQRIFTIASRLDQQLTLERLMQHKNSTVTDLMERLEINLMRNQVDYMQGEARFLEPHLLEVRQEGAGEERVSSACFLISTGSSPYRPPFVDFDQKRVLDSDTILDITEIPRTMSIFGGGVIGCEYASIFSNMGVKVNLINPRDRLLDFLDREISTSLNYLMRDAGVRVRLGEHLKKVVEEDSCVYAHTQSGKIMKSDYLLYANGRMGNTTSLGLEVLGLETNARNQLTVNAFYQTQVPHIYAAGDVIGFPSLAATSMEQGRLAVLHAFEALPKNPRPHNMPTGIYTIPEISTVGETEEQLTKKKVPYEVGVSSYREVTRSQIAGSTLGRLKLLFHRETHEVLGVHIIGENATDLLHIGQAVMDYQGKVEYFVDNVFNYPSYSEGYRLAALNGLNRL